MLSVPEGSGSHLQYVREQMGSHGSFLYKELFKISFVRIPICSRMCCKFYNGSGAEWGLYLLFLFHKGPLLIHFFLQSSLQSWEVTLPQYEAACEKIALTPKLPKTVPNSQNWNQDFSAKKNNSSSCCFFWRDMVLYVRLGTLLALNFGNDGLVQGIRLF